MDGSRGYYAKWNKTEREKKNTPLFHLYVECNQNKQTKMKRLTYIEIRQKGWLLEGKWGNKMNVGELGKGD